MTSPMTTNDLLDSLKAHFGAQSDYALSKKMGWTRQRISNYRNRVGAMDDVAAIQTAEALGLQPGLVLAWMHAERTDSPAIRAAWQQVATSLDHATGDKESYPVLCCQLSTKKLTTNNHLHKQQLTRNERRCLDLARKKWEENIFRIADRLPPGTMDPHLLCELRWF